MASIQCHRRHQIKHASGMSPSHTLHQVSESEQFPTRKIKKPKLTNTGLSRIIHIFICMYLHLPSICLLRPLSVPRTLPHPLQIRFQRRHTPRGEKPREQWGFRAETSRVAGDSELGLPVLSLPPAPQHNMVQVYKKQAWVFLEKIKTS